MYSVSVTLSKWLGAFAALAGPAALAAPAALSACNANRASSAPAAHIDATQADTPLPSEPSEDAGRPAGQDEESGQGDTPAPEGGAARAADDPALWEAFHFPLAPLGACPADHGAARLVGPWGGPQVLGSEEKFQRIFCAPSQIDWSTSRLVVWVQTRNSPNTVVQGASLSEDKLVVRWRRRHFCHGADSGNQLWASAAKIPVTPGFVESRIADTPAPDCQNVP